MTKICFTSSSGGHLEELLMLQSLMEQYESFIVTEKTSYEATKKYPTYYLKQVNRREKRFIVNILANLCISLKILVKEKPDFIISTGALATVPICILGKLFGKKLIFIESFAKVHSKTKTGSLLYYFADQFYVQWESMKPLYPKSIYKGAIY